MCEEADAHHGGVDHSHDQLYRHRATIRRPATIREWGLRQTRRRIGRALKIGRNTADDGGVSTPFVAVDAPSGGREAVRQQFSEIELAHALRATAAQQLRVVAVAHGQQGRGGARTAALEQAIADRIERIVEERRAAAVAARTPHGTAPHGRDELAVRRTLQRRSTGGRALA